MRGITALHITDEKFGDTRLESRRILPSVSTISSPICSLKG